MAKTVGMHRHDRGHQGASAHVLIMDGGIRERELEAGITFAGTSTTFMGRAKVVAGTLENKRVVSFAWCAGSRATSLAKVWIRILYSVTL